MKNWTKMYGRNDQLVLLKDGQPINSDVKRVSALTNGALMKGKVLIGRNYINVQSTDSGNLWNEVA